MAWDAGGGLMPMMGCLGLLPLLGVVFVVSGSSFALMDHFFLVFGGFRGACFGLTICVLVGWRPGIEAGVSGFGLTHW